MRPIYYIVLFLILFLFTAGGFYLLSEDELKHCPITAEWNGHLLHSFLNNGKHYLFLPSEARAEQLRFGDTDTILGEGPLTEETEYILIRKKRFGLLPLQTRLIFRRSQLPSMLIELPSEHFQKINASKDHSVKRQAVITVLDKKEQRIFNGVLKGRGNGTWHFVKKPYSIHFNEEISLMGLRPGKSYALLANLDVTRTQLKNKLAFEFAKTVGIPQTPGCEFCELWVNGEYYGLYLLSENKHIEKNRVNLGTQDWMIRYSIPERSDIHSQRVCQTTSGTYYDIITVENQLPDKEAITDFLNAVESAIQENKNWSLYIDAESFAKKLLLESLYANIDQLSLYFIYDHTSQKLFAGPPWDYEHGLCMKYSSEIERQASTLYCMLYRQSPEFQKIVKQIYEQTFLPIYRSFHHELLSTLKPQLDVALRNDVLRWNWNKEEYHWDNIANQLLTELENNQNMFSGYYCNQEPYIPVVITELITTTASGIWRFRVPRGTLCDSLYHSSTWQGKFPNLYDAQTGCLVSPEMPITEPLQLVTRYPEMKSEVKGKVKVKVKGAREREASSFLINIRKCFGVWGGISLVIFILLFGYMLGKKVVWDNL